MPWATIKGRVVDEEGEPLENVQVYAVEGAVTNEPPVNEPPAMRVTKFALPLPPSDGRINATYCTNAKGEFEILGLSSGHACGPGGTAPANFDIPAFA